MQNYSRRHFLKSTALVGAAATLPSFTSLNAQSANNKLRVGVIGVNGRGMDHVGSFTQIPNVEIAWICDVDSRALDKALGVVQERTGSKPKGATDLRRVLDDKSVDAISIATPNHWHAPAAIMACAAGKHVYVEKPGSHDPFESQMIVAAARKHNRVVQQGTQRRSWPWIQEAMQRLHEGVIGEVYFARTWYNNSRGTIGQGKVVPVPSWLNFELWQGPAPEHPYTDNLLHYHWHWFWNYGNGEVGNNGIHFLDLARWGLQVGLPKTVSCTGGRYHFQDDQQTPDTCVATFDFGGKGATFDCHSCDPYGFEGAGTGVLFYGTKGTLSMPGNTYKIYDQNKKQIEEKKGAGSNKVHFENFVDSIRSGKRPNADIEECQKSTMLCHLANIAYRTGHTIHFDPATKKIVGDGDAKHFWKREYRRGWEPRV